MWDDRRSCVARSSAYNDISNAHDQTDASKLCLGTGRRQTDRTPRAHRPIVNRSNVDRHNVLLSTSWWPTGTAEGARNVVTASKNDTDHVAWRAWWPARIRNAIRLQPLNTESSFRRRGCRSCLRLRADPVYVVTCSRQLGFVYRARRDLDRQPVV